MMIANRWHRSLLMGVVLTGWVAAPALAQEEAPPRPSEIRLNEKLIEDFLYVIYFTNDGRYDFKEYAECNYEYLQNPVVAIEGDVVKVSAEYYRRTATEGLGACIGGLGTSTNATVSTRLRPNGESVTLEIFEITTETMPMLTNMLLEMTGMTLPMSHDFNLMSALNGVLYEKAPFGVSALEVHAVDIDGETVLLQLTMQLGIW